MKRASAGPASKPGSILSVAIASIIYSGLAPRDGVADTSDEALSEILVTARKRVEYLQDVPQNIDVYTERDLNNLDIVRLEDYAALTPSISLISTGPGQQRIFIRGASDGSNPNYGFGNVSTTGFLLDDLSFSFYGHDPDLHLYDIERIEILNGPQGTLFGPGAMSGAVRIITKKPDPGAFSAGVDFEGGQVDGGAGNWTHEGYANIPLIEGTTALRLSAYSVREGGYIENVLSTRHWLNGTTSTNGEWAGRNQNTREILGGRLAVQHNLSDHWRAILTGYYQQQKYNGTWEEDPTTVGDRQVRRFSPQGGYNYSRFLDLHVEGDAGIADIVYAGGYSTQQSRRLYDFSEYAQYNPYASFTQSLACVTDPGSGPGDHGCKVPYMYASPGGGIDRWSNELRLESKPGGREHWTVGGYWEKTRNPYSAFIHQPNINFSGETAQSLLAGSGATPLAEEVYSTFGTFDYLETTEFGDMTVDLDERWSAEGGVEHFHSTTSDSTDWAGQFYEPKTPSYHRASSSKTNFKAGLNFKPDPHLLVYFSFAQGFRDGSFNYLPTGLDDPSIPTYFQPDTLDNFELGWKTEYPNSLIIWNGSLYYMPWKNYQTTVNVPGPPFAFNANVGDARIIGIESTLEVQPLDGLHLSLAASYNDSTLRSNSYQNPSFLVVPGERLPEAPAFNWSGVARYERRVGAATGAFAQVDVSHKGSMWNDLRVDSRVLQPAYTIGNVRFGVSQPAGHWQAEAYVSNVRNTRAVVFANQTGYAYFPGHSAPQIDTVPRVFGLRLSYAWGASRR